MSNLGLMRAMKQAGINVEVTDVGDRYVIERMRGGSFNVGGEQSGHIIFMDYATTGDGIISALHVLKLMRQTGRPLAELAGFMNVFPQEIRSFGVAGKRRSRSFRACLPKSTRAARRSVNPGARSCVTPAPRTRSGFSSRPSGATMSGSGSSGCRPRPARS